jgi:hypothetical protein
VSQDGVVRIEDGNSRNELHPLLRARQFINDMLIHAKRNPYCSSLLRHDEEQGGFRFPTGYLLILSNCTTNQISYHKLGDLHTVFGHDHIIGRETIKEFEQWKMADLIPFLRSCVHPQGRSIPLTCDLVHIIRSIIHPEIIINLPQSGYMTGALESGNSLKVLDCVQEQTLHQISLGHTLFYGVSGSGKTSIMVARARLLHNLHLDYQILVLCVTRDLCNRLQELFSVYPRIEVCLFDKWAEKSGVFRLVMEGKGAESDMEYGTRFYEFLLSSGDNAPCYDAVFIDEGHAFCPSWFLCARHVIKDKDGGNFFITADGLHALAGIKGVSWKELGIHVRGHIFRHGMTLEKNYQNTREILNLARLFILPEIEGDEDEYKKLVLACDCSTRSGLKPLLIWNTSQQAQAEYSIYLVKRLLGSIKSAQYLSGIKPNDIAILYPGVEADEKNIIRAMVSDLCLYCPVQWISEGHNTHERLDLPGVKVHDRHSIRGIYYRVVMILFTENFERFFSDSEFFSEKSLFYEALIRPLDYLTLQYTDRTDIIRKMLASDYVDEFIGK